MKILFYLPVILIYGLNLIIFIGLCYLPFDQNLDLSIDLGFLVLKDGFVRLALIILDCFLLYKIVSFVKKKFTKENRNIESE